MADGDIDHEPMDFQEEELATSSSNIADTKFDVTIGHIEDLIMEDEFQEMQSAFLEKHYEEFEDTEENKFIYTDIHKEYLNLVEKFLEEQLTQRMPGFSMLDFSKSRKEELEGEIFEILLTFTDFIAFKEMFLDYRAEKEGSAIDLSDGITITHMPELVQPIQPAEPVPQPALESQKRTSNNGYNNAEK